MYSYRGTGIGNGVRVLLVYLADNMRADRTVSVPRSRIAKALAISTAEVTARVKAAHQVGLLDTVQHGRPGITAVYQGLFPIPQLGNPGVTKLEPEHGTGNPTSRPGQLGNPGVATSSKRSAAEAVVSQSSSRPSKIQSSLSTSSEPVPIGRALSDWLDAAAPGEREWTQ